MPTPPPPAHSRFKPGQTGNPAGRKRGSRNRLSKSQKQLLVAADTLRQTLEGKVTAEAPLIIESLVDQAKAGDVAAAKLLVSSILPPLPSGEKIRLPSLRGLTPTEQMRAVMDAVLAGDVSAQTGRQVLEGLRAVSGAQEAELWRRWLVLVRSGVLPLAAAREVTGDATLDPLVEREAGVYSAKSTLIRRVL